MTDKRIEAKQFARTGKWDSRHRTGALILLAFLFLIFLAGSGLFIGEENLEINFNRKNEPPSFSHPFGTDWLGRDMLARTFKGLSLSFWIGLSAAAISTMIAILLSILAAWNKILDGIVTWLIDLFLSLPHIVLLLLISFSLGGGYKGVIIGLALTHWPSLTRLFRGELMQIKEAEYVGISRNLGKSYFWIVRHHYLPYFIPQIMVGFVLLFPHAILHEAAITFLGFGLPPEQPAIGIILAESMQYLSMGLWWLAFFPGLSLFFMVSAFDFIGKKLQRF